MATKPPNINLIHPSLNGGASFNPIFIDIGFPDQRTDKKKANITPFLSGFTLFSLCVFTNFKNSNYYLFYFSNHNCIFV